MEPRECQDSGFLQRKRDAENSPRGWIVIPSPMGLAPPLPETDLASVVVGGGLAESVTGRLVPWGPEGGLTAGVAAH